MNLSLTIFKNANPLPKNKSEKIASIRTANTFDKVPVRNFDELLSIVTTFVWSPSIFLKRRVNEDFAYCDFIVFDIDDGMTIPEAQKVCEELNYCCLCLSSPSHTDENHRFRLIFPLARRISTKEEFFTNWQNLGKNFTIDMQCSNAGRLYFACKKVNGFILDNGELYNPILKLPVMHQKKEFLFKPKVPVSTTIKDKIYYLYGEDREYVPECVDFFLKNGSTGLKGMWWVSLNSFCLTLSLQGVTEEKIYSIVNDIAPYDLDDIDHKCISIAIRDGIKERGEVK